MARDDDETSWTRQLLVGVGALAAVSLVIGGVVSLVALGAARVTGLDDSQPAATQAPSLYFPDDDPTTSLDTFPDPAGTEQTRTPSPSATPSSPKPKKRTRSISLQAFPATVAPNERINLTGVYDGAEGARLQVQRFENGWVDFPVSTSVSGGQFHTYVFSGRQGLNRFRMVDTDSGRKSNAVRVTIG